MREKLIVLIAATALACAPANDSRNATRAKTSDATFYDFYLDRYLASEATSGFAAERAGLRALTGEDIDAFDWSRLGRDPGLFDEIQTLRFLLPWLADVSGADMDRARRWLMSWYVRHGLDESVEPRWGSELASAQRTLVLVFWLKQEERRGASSEDPTLQVLRDAMRMHEQYLAEDEHFNGASNVGVLESIALAEAGRLASSPGVAQTSARRLLATLDAILSPQGATLEHSAHYHFIVLAWAEAALATYERNGDESAKPLRAHVARMRRAGYFLVDSGDRVVQIGDSDSTTVPGLTDRVTRDAGNPGAVFFDSLAGFAVYKSARAQEDGRYVVYRIQRGAIKYWGHCHADAMSLVAVWDGETVLGDSGRYRYGATGSYFSSHQAHNSIFPEGFLSMTSGHSLSSVVSAGSRRAGADAGWWARMDWNGTDVARGVSIPATDRTVVVEDTIGTPEPNAPASRFCWVWNAGSDVREVTLETKQSNSMAWVAKTYRGRRFRFVMTVTGDATGVDAELLRGATGPELGWYSPVYGVKRPSWVVLVRIRPGRVVTVRTVIEPER